MCVRVELRILCWFWDVLAGSRSFDNKESAGVVVKRGDWFLFGFFGSD